MQIHAAIRIYDYGAMHRRINDDWAKTGISLPIQ